MITAAINVHALVKMLYSSVVAGVAISVVFSFAILGVARSSEARREHRTVAATAYSAVAAVGLLVAAAIVIYGLMLVVQDKS